MFNVKLQFVLLSAAFFQQINGRLGVVVSSPLLESPLLKLC